MQLTWLPESRRFVATQTEARGIKMDFEVVDVPTVKKDLMDYLNGREEQYERDLAAAVAAARAEAIAAAGSVEAGRDEQAENVEAKMGAPAVEETPPVPVTSAIGGGGGELADRIDALDKVALIPVLSAAIARLSEIAGVSGWAAFGKDLYAWTPSARGVERGLGMLMLAAFNRFGDDGREAPAMGRIVPDKASRGDED